ncbi:sensor histidine kinase [Ramlibacter humi]|uniref:histidine kinase n=1 Tax=Ramlibacter humi TaxID=2530451 RepID=A0A4Z0BU68_9BURK|nr:ATP-binding protein [Ramlibacter humi]TFZ01808.1 HAMP domain-containing protein [Ramlibacter humi]
MKLRLPLYLRVWLAVIAAVAVLTIAFGALWQAYREQVRSEQSTPPREIILRNEAGDVLGQGTLQRPRVPGQGLVIDVPMKDGRTIVVQIPPRPRRAGEGPPGVGPFLPGGPTGLFWLLGIVAIAVVIATYPFIRRLTHRLENLRTGVERWGEGDLAARVDQSGTDEVAFLAARFNHAAERVETLVKSHKSLLANASHELRSPLARIRMGMELMDGPPTPTQRQEILRSIAELDQLIDEILLASRLDARESDVGTFEPVDLTGLAAEESARSGAELVIDGGEVVQANGVVKLLRRAVRNLLENARRYTTGPVEIDVRREGGYAVVRVADRGPGVPPPQRERIFEPFYRLPGASEREGGVGLGLALVRSIAQRHHGTVHCEDREGGGAVFVLRLPA